MRTGSYIEDAFAQQVSREMKSAKNSLVRKKRG
jgi:hypothetical protein